MTFAHRLLRELIALPSVNPASAGVSPARAGEKSVAEYLAAVAAQAGLDVDFKRVLPGRSNVLVRLSPQAPVARVILAPHMDTVNGTDEQFVPQVKGDRLYGRGACDTKGSVAAMLSALLRVAESGPRPTRTEVLFLGLVDEEDAQKGSRSFAASGEKADLAIVGEPTKARVVTAHKGSIWLELATKGRSAHGSQPERGVNAVLSMAPVVQLLESTYSKHLRRRSHPLLGPPTSSVGTISGGTQPNIVPDSCVVRVDRRTLPGETERTVLDEVRRLLRSHKHQAEVKSVKQAACPPLETDSDHRLVRSLMRSARQREPMGAQYFCDAAVLAGGGIPSVVFGPGDISQAHTADEWISLRSLDRATAILESFVRSLP